MGGGAACYDVSRDDLFHAKRIHTVSSTRVGTYMKREGKVSSRWPDDTVHQKKGWDNTSLRKLR